MFKLLVLISVVFISSMVNGEDIKTDYLKSYNYEQMGKYAEAIKVLAPLYKKYPKGYTLNLRFGWLFYLNKDYNNAISHYQKASVINPYALDPRLGLIRVYLDTASFGKAESMSYELLKIDYYNYYANLYAVKSLLAQKKYKLSKQMAIKMLALYPTDITYLEELALIYKATKDRRLKQLYDDILILDPNNVMVKSSI